MTDFLTAKKKFLGFVSWGLVLSGDRVTKDIIINVTMNKNYLDKPYLFINYHYVCDIHMN